jgi:hypothetical protein
MPKRNATRDRAIAAYKAARYGLTDAELSRAARCYGSQMRRALVNGGMVGRVIDAAGKPMTLDIDNRPQAVYVWQGEENL